MDFKKMSAYEGPKKSPGFLLWHVSTEWRGVIESVLKGFGLTHPQFVVLATTGWLTRNGESTTQVAIGKMAGIDPNTISQIIKGLEKKGLLKREASSDGRAKNPRLTSQGRRLVDLALPAVEKADHRFFGRISSKQLESLVSVFQKLVD